MRQHIRFFGWMLQTSSCALLLCNLLSFSLVPTVEAQNSEQQQQQQQQQLTGDNSGTSTTSTTTPVYNAQHPYYYDLLRKLAGAEEFGDGAAGDGSNGTFTGSSNHIITNVLSGADFDAPESKVYQITLNETLDLSEYGIDSSSGVGEGSGGGELQDVLLMADLKAFLPFSDADEVKPIMINDAFCALLAIYHFNNIETSPILTQDDVAECPSLKLTMELFDTHLSPILTTRSFTSVLQRTPTFSTPPAAGVIGAFRSAVTSPLAILTGVNWIPQVSHASTAVDFDIKTQFPLFGRTCTSSVGEAEVAVRFFQSINSEQVAILFITDSYGSALQKAFQDAANEVNITTESVPFSFVIDEVEARAVVESLINIQYRHVYAILFDSQFDIIMQTAVEMGAAGVKDCLWVLPGLDVNDMQTPPKFGTSLAKAYDGLGIIQMQGGVTEQSLVIGEPAHLGESSDPDSGFDKFRSSWGKALEDDAFVDFVRTKLPDSYSNDTSYDPTTPFVDDPGAFRPFLYDAVTALALSMCQASVNKTFFRGDEVYKYFLQNSFHGASGQVLVDNVTGTRDYKTISFVMWNSRVAAEPDEQGNARVELVPARVYDGGEWKKISQNKFIFANGTTVPPLSLPPVNYDYNYIGRTGRIVGYTLMALTIVSSVLSLIWLALFRREHVVSSAQPLFLLMVGLGTAVMSMTIIPLTLEEPLSQQTLNQACMAVPWLYVAGSTVALSGLLAKTRGVVEAYLNPDLDFIHVSACDIFVFFMLYFVPNLIVLISWTMVSPLEWHRVPTGATDIFGRESASYAQCYSSHSLTFTIVLCAVNFFTLLLGNCWAYRARNIETEYGESSYIGVSMAAVLQAWTMGIPILIVVWNSPPAKFHVSSGIIFVTSQAILCLVFAPKMIAMYKAKKFARGVKKRAYKKFIKNRHKANEFEDDAENDDDDNDASDYEFRKAAKLAKLTNSAARLDSNKGETGGESSDKKMDNAGVVIASVMADDNSVVNPQDPSAVNFSEAPRNAGRHDSDYLYPSVASENEELSRRPASWAGEGGSRLAPSTRAPAQSWEGEADAPGVSNKSKNARFSRRFGKSAVNSKEVPENIGSIKIVHHPRATCNLAVSGGVELSRRQLIYLREHDKRKGPNGVKEESAEGEDGATNKGDGNRGNSSNEHDDDHDDSQVKSYDSGRYTGPTLSETAATPAVAGAWDMSRASTLNEVTRVEGDDNEDEEILFGRPGSSCVGQG